MGLPLCLLKVLVSLDKKIYMVNQSIENQTLSCPANLLALLHACMLVSVTLEAPPFCMQSSAYAPQFKF